MNTTLTYDLHTASRKQLNRKGCFLLLCIASEMFEHRYMQAILRFAAIVILEHARER